MSSINNRNPPVLPPPQLNNPADIAEHMERTAAPVAKPAGKVLEEHEAEQVAQAPKKMNASDAERVFSQSGYARVGKRRGKGMDLDDSQGPVALPVDEVDESAWEQRSLDDAQEQLTMQSTQLKQLAKDVAADGAGELGIFGKLISATFQPTEEDIERLSRLESAPPQPQVAMGDVNQSMARMFGIKLDQVQNGPAMVAAALVVAGLSEAVVPEGDSLEANKLAQGMQKVVEDSNTAVGDARNMSSGITKQLAVHRTFMFKR